MNKIKREERENLHTFSDTTNDTVAFTLPNIHYIFLKFIIQMQAK